MWIYSAMLMLSLCAPLVNCSGSRPIVCRTDDYLQIQETCHAENNDLLQAVKTHDDGMVCKKLVDVFYCVAGHVPQCFHNLTGMYKNYFHSPHNCALSPQHIMSLQNLTISTAHRQHPHESAKVDVEVELIVPVSTPSPEENSPSQEEGKEEGGDGVRGGGEEGMRHEGQSGSGAAKMTTSTTTIALVTLIAWTGACRMTSLPLS